MYLGDDYYMQRARSNKHKQVAELDLLGPVKPRYISLLFINGGAYLLLFRFPPSLLILVY